MAVKQKRASIRGNRSGPDTWNWRLLYRTEADYRAIFARTSFGAAALHFEHEPLRANLFAVAARP